MLSSSESKPFDLIIDKYKKKDGPSKNQTLSELEEKYNSIINENKQKITNILENGRLYRFVHCTADELIKVYDITLNGTSTLERKEYERTLEKIISEVTVEFIEEYAYDGVDACQRVPIDVYQQRDEIAELCQKNREFTKYYEKCKSEIEDTYHEDRMVSFSQQKIDMMSNPQWIQEQKLKLLNLLLGDKLIRKNKNEDASIEYRISEDTNTTKIQEALKSYIKCKQILFLEIDAIDNFMERELKFQNGNSLHNALRVKKYRPKKN